MLRLIENTELTEANALRGQQLIQAKKIQSMVRDDIERVGFRTAFNMDISGKGDMVNGRNISMEKGFQILPAIKNVLSQVDINAELNSQNEIVLQVFGTDLKGQAINFGFNSYKKITVDEFIGKQLDSENESESENEVLPPDGYITKVLEKCISILAVLSPSNILHEASIRSIVQKIKNSVTGVFDIAAAKKKDKQTVVSTLAKVGKIIEEGISSELSKSSGQVNFSVKQSGLNLRLQLTAKQVAIIYYSVRDENNSLYISQIETPMGSVDVDPDFQSQGDALKGLGKALGVRFDKVIRQLPAIADIDIKTGKKETNDSSENSQPSSKEKTSDSNEDSSETQDSKSKDEHEEGANKTPSDSEDTEKIDRETDNENGSNEGEDDIENQDDADSKESSDSSDQSSEESDTEASVSDPLKNILKKLPAHIIQNLGFHPTLTKAREGYQFGFKYAFKLNEAALSQVKFPHVTTSAIQPKASAFNDAFQDANDISQKMAVVELFLYVRFGLCNQNVKDFEDILERLTSPTYLQNGFNLGVNFKLKLAAIYLIINKTLPQLFDQVIEKGQLRDIFKTHGGDVGSEGGVILHKFVQPSVSDPNASPVKEKVKLMINGKLAIFYVPSLYYMYSASVNSVANTIALWYNLYEHLKLNDPSKLSKKLEEVGSPEWITKVAEIQELPEDRVQKLSLADLVYTIFFNPSTQKFNAYSQIAESISELFPKFQNSMTFEDDDEPISTERSHKDSDMTVDTFSASVEQHNRISGKDMQQLIKTYKLSPTQQKELGKIIADFVTKQTAKEGSN